MGFTPAPGLNAAQVDARIAAYLAANPPAGGGGGVADARTLFRDDCAAAALPSGLTTTGGVSFNATTLERRLSGAATYAPAAQPLNGLLLASLEVTNLSTLNGADLTLAFYKGASLVARVAWQADGNVVAYNSAGSARGNSASGAFWTVAGVSLRIALAVHETGQCSATAHTITGGSSTAGADGQNSNGFATLLWTSGLAGLTAGDSLTAQLTQSAGTGTRITGLLRFAVAKGRPIN